MIFAKERYTYRPDLFLVYNNRRRLVKRIATYGKKSGTNGKLHRLFQGNLEGTERPFSRSFDKNAPLPKEQGGMGDFHGTPFSDKKEGAFSWVL